MVVKQQGPNENPKPIPSQEPDIPRRQAPDDDEPGRRASPEQTPPRGPEVPPMKEPPNRQPPPGQVPLQS